MVDILIRPLYEPAEMRQVVELQKLYWGDAADALVPPHMLLSLVRYGGHVLGAFDDTKLVGVLVGFLGTNSTMDKPEPAADNLLIMSKRMVVLPEYRGQHIGYRLKLAQRDIALKQGIPLVTWTFDPLLARNAYLNIHKLGGISQNYKVDYFGADENNPTLGADRIVVDWWVSHPHVVNRLDPQIPDATFQDYLVQGAALVSYTDVKQSDLPEPPSFKGVPDVEVILFEIPVDLNAIDNVLVKVWRSYVREFFEEVMLAGFVVTDFLRTNHKGQVCVFYVLRHSDQMITF